MKRLIAAPLAVLWFLLAISAGVSAQATDEFEDYESFNVGDIPSASWYSVSGGCSDPDGDTCVVQGFGLDGTSQSLSSDRVANTAQTLFILDTTAEVNTPSIISMYMEMDGGDIDAQRIDFEGSGGEIVFRLQTVSFAGNWQIRHAQSACGGLVDTTDTGISSQSETFMEFTFDYGADTFTWDFNNGASTGSEPFFDCSNNLERIQHNRGSPTQDGLIMDQILWDGTSANITEPPANITASEFDTGLIDTSKSLGFKSPASQFLFGLILISFAAIITAVISERSGGSSQSTAAATNLVSSATAVFVTIIGQWPLWTSLVVLTMTYGTFRISKFILDNKEEIQGLIRESFSRSSDDDEPISLTVTRDDF